MKMRTAMCRAGIALLLACGFPFAVTAAENAKLVSARTIYQNNLDKIETKYSENAKNWPIQYMAALKELQDRVQKAGDLEGWQAINKELKRFQETNVVTKDVLISTPPALRSLQEQYLDIDAKHAYQQPQEIVTLTQQYIQHLTDLQKELTVAGKMDDAVTVNAEIKTAKANPRFTAAEFAVAEYEAKLAAQNQPAKEPRPAEPALEPRKEPALPKQPPPDQPPPQGPSAIQVYADGKKPPELPNVDFKRLTLRSPKLGSNPRNLVVNAMLASVPDVSERDSNTPPSPATTKLPKTKHFLRVTLRTAMSNTTLLNLTAAVQAFVSPADDVSARKTPRQLGVKTAGVAKLDDQTVWLDCPPITTSKSEVDRRAANRVDAPAKEGADFAGIVVSVFDADRTLIYQAGSDPSLNELGLTRLPEPSDDREEARRRLEEARTAAKKAAEAHFAAPKNRERERDFREALERLRTTRDGMEQFRR